AAASNQLDVQIRIITYNATASDEWVGIDDINVTGSVEDAAPSVSSTVPTNGALNVAVNTNITVNFSEAVDVAAGAITVECPAGNVVASNAVVDNLPSVVIDPASDLPFSTACTINVAASGVSDEDTNDPPDAMLANFNSTFTTAAPVSTSAVVISQVYGGGGNTGATYKNDFIELYNRSASPVDVTGWSVQYASSAGITWAKTDLSGIIQPGQYYLIQEAAGTGGTVDLPTPNATGNIAMSGTAGKVALVNSTTALSGSGCPFVATVVDFVGYGGANCSETAPTAALSNTTAALRNGNGATDTNNNSADFTVGAPTPRNTPPPAPNLNINDVSLNEGNSGTTTFTFTVSLSSPAQAGGVTFDIATADNTSTVADSDYQANSLPSQTIPAGSSTYMFSVLVNGDATDEGNDETFFVHVTNVTGAILVDGQGLGTIVNDDVDFCAQTFTPIYTIQGSGLSAPTPGNVTTQGVVVGDFEGTAAASGFYIQDLSGDGDAATSDGIFVFTGSSNLASVGDVVRVTGFARERFNQTTLNGSNSNTAPVTNVVNCGSGSVTATDVSLPFASATSPEPYEGMLVRFPQSLVIAEYFNYGRFGEMVLALPLAGESRPFSGTAIDEPGAAANARTAANALSRITLDDAQSAQNPPALRHPNGLPFSLTNLFRGGDTVQNAVGVLSFDFSLYRIVPTGPADYNAVNPRPASPEPVGGTLRTAVMNTLNFFVTLDPSGGPLDNKCGPANSLECRGADDSGEFTRQRDKLLIALAGLDADIIGLNELENSTGVEPLASIVSGLSGYDYIDTGTIGTDAIKVGLIYRSAVVTPVGDFKLLTSAVDPRFIDTRSRPSLAQTFEVNATGARFTVVVNHLKSKSSACAGDPDLLDGQGNCSQTRRAAAEALVDWLATDPTGSGDPDFLIIGDLNSYAMEDAIDEIKAGADDVAGTTDDFTNLISHFHGAYAYSYTFDGQAGYLDHALANSSIFSQVTGAAEWHINSDEPTVLDYDTTFKPDEQDALYEVNQYRTSDHDAVVIGLNLLNTPPVAANDSYSTNEDTSLTVTAPGVLSNDSDAESHTLTAVLVSGPSHGTITLNANGSFTYAPASNYNGPDSFTYKANDGHADGNEATVFLTVNAVNDAPVATPDSATVARNGSVAITALANDTDVDGDTLTVTSFTQGVHGTVAFSTKNRNFRYTPARGFRGTDTFTYTISDGNGGTSTTTVTITVQ
ncbi:MAG: ExeM/NucH family extracellular endonuclease, partial [Chloroflexota bacterium]|nr:ExeM/NucH family extracellular endonuclease [Chloroflexota bacterium]